MNVTEEAGAPAEPLVQWDVPGINGSRSTEIVARAGHAIVVVGPNGSGKSALSHWLSVNRGGSSAPVTRVLAHRRLWLQSAGAEITASQRQQYASVFPTWDSNPNSRTMVEGDAQRSSKLLYDLLGSVNGRNARIADLVDAHQDAYGVEESMLTKIARVFQAANLGMSFRVSNHGTFDAISMSSDPFPISEMSDGEKGAFLLAAETLLSPASSVQILDEPERHLHRAISSDFIAALMRERQDCAFVLLTHDLDLSARLEPTTTAVCTLSGVSWTETVPSGWSLTIDSDAREIPDSVRAAILGGRTRLLFVEGQASSLDYPLYQLLFPGWTIVPCGGAEEVKRATSGLNGAESYHWVDGRGVLDGDARTPDEIAALASKKTLVLPVNEVENLYYLSFVVDAIAEQQAKALGDAADSLSIAARENALTALKTDAVQHLASVNAVKILRSQALASLPSGQEMVAGGVTLAITLTSPYPVQHQQLNDRIARKDYDAIVRDYSVRDSGFLKAVAQGLGFQSREHYERAVRVRLKEDAELLMKLREVVGELPA